MSSCTTLKQILHDDAESTYLVTERLFRRVADRELSWRPATGKDWMSVGQLLMHCARFGCGLAVRGFMRRGWRLVGDVEDEDVEVRQHLPPVERLRGVESVEQALDLLALDRELALRCITEVEDAELLTRRFPAPWGGPELTLFQHLLLMIRHLAQHKGQLFYYLKLMGKEVGSTDLWGE